MPNTQKSVVVVVAILALMGGAYIYWDKNFSARAQKQTRVETICTLGPDSTVDDSSYLNSVTFLARDRACATVAGEGTGNEFVTFRGKTSGPWEYVMLTEFSADFSPDGKHFVYTASHVPLNQIPYITSTGERADWKPQRFVVIDGTAGPTYDDIYRPHYSPDGAHLGYCAYKGGIVYGDGHFVKVIDGKESGTTRNITDCEKLFGPAKQWPNGRTMDSPDGERRLEAYFDPAARSNCLMAGCPVFVDLVDSITKEKIKMFGPFGTFPLMAFSPDSKHYAFFAGRLEIINTATSSATESDSIIIDGEKRPAPYFEIFNMHFSDDSQKLHFNARDGNKVYYVTEPVSVR